MESTIHFTVPHYIHFYCFRPEHLYGENWHICARLLQCLLSIICSFMIFKIAHRVTGNRIVGLVALVLYLSHLATQAEHYAQRETVLFEMILLFWIYIISTKNFSDTKTMATASLLSAGLYLTRPTGILFVLLTGLVVLYRSKKDRNIKRLLVSLGVLVLAVGPWQFYNYKVFSKVTLSSSSTSGLNLYKGASPVVQSIFPQIDIDCAAPYIQSQLKNKDIDVITEEYKANTFFIKEAKTLIIQNPIYFLKKMFKQFLIFYSPVFTPLGRGNAMFDGVNLVLQNSSFSFGLIELSHFVMAMLLIPFGMLELLKIHDVNVFECRFKIFSLLIFMLMTVMHMLSFAETRFRLPLDGLLCVATGIFYVRHFRNHQLT